jgi:precorrin-6Y C5,15-methyltransferase (decarboxylating)
VGDRCQVAVVGMLGGEWFGATAGKAVQEATIIVGSSRLLGHVARNDVRKVELGADLGRILGEVQTWRSEGESVCLLASGDPGFFGLARLAAARFGPGGVSIHPAPSSVSMAAARAGTTWDDAVVVSVHGRPAQPAVDTVLHSPKVAVLCSPETPPESLGARLLDAGCPARAVTVASRLGEPDESVWSGDVSGLAAGRFDPLSVVLLAGPEPAASAAGWRWGRPESEFAHRNGLITKAEVRAVALGKLGLLPAGVMWDVGAGSGSVAAECAAVAPGLRIFAVEQDPRQLPLLRTNLAGRAVTVVEGRAPAALGPLPDPDRAFVGGGGPDVLAAVLKRLRPGGRVVATYASVDRAVSAAERLGRMVEVSISRAVPIGSDRSLRLAAENPVFVCWGPGE